MQTPSPLRVAAGRLRLGVAGGYSARAAPAAACALPWTRKRQTARVRTVPHTGPTVPAI